ncbi:MAG: heat-shock protein Hsp20 [Halobacteriovoraceae bacterium]|nr:heat-shock protein Hsp20 [Halobacteriovoraceae bacterium]|tara:strand:+ start:32374 stop:32736 length:363 start_codon:yes stop_codon:yes gene_type:complete
MKTLLPLYAEELAFRKKVDFYSKETEGAWKIAIEVPGVKKEGLDIEAVSNSLKISGQKLTPFEEESRDFERVFNLPEGVDYESITASLENGLLSITLPKVKEKRPRKIEITTAEEAVYAQ